ncbi:MAG: hypothetical protein H7177_06700 [Rhizobacter sp.]|nr:hypothetical protein [Bacteriovorax sp.]
MKIFFVILALSFSFSAFACPQLDGIFSDSDSESNRTIVQSGCTSSTWTDADGTTTLIADNVERVLQAEGSMTAYAKVSFTNDDLIIDIRMDYGGNNQYDLPVRWITSYRIDKFNNLVEKIQPFEADGSEGSTDYQTYRRVK